MARYMAFQLGIVGFTKAGGCEDRQLTQFMLTGQRVLAGSVGW